MKDEHTDGYDYDHDFRQPKKHPPQLHKPVELAQMGQLVRLMQAKNWPLQNTMFGWENGQPFAVTTIDGIGQVMLAGDLYGRNVNVQEFVVVSVNGTPWSRTRLPASPEYTVFWLQANALHPKAD